MPESFMLLFENQELKEENKLLKELLSDASNYIIDYLNNGDFVWNKELEEELNKYKIIKSRLENECHSAGD